jgi:hypothetical protein
MVVPAATSEQEDVMSLILRPLCGSPATLRPGVSHPPLVAIWEEVAPMLATLVACWRRMQANGLAIGVSIELYAQLEALAVWYEGFRQAIS